jgi:hypothetical protein
VNGYRPEYVEKIFTFADTVTLMPKSLHHCCQIYCNLDAEITAFVITENTALLDAVNILYYE